MVETLRQWAVSANGSPIALFMTQSLDRPILLIGGVHGDEPEGVELAQKTLTWLQQQETSTQSLVKVSWIVIPCLNVDGFATGQRVNGHGVDLNRNYPAKSWSPTFTKERYHPGASPGSEPEIQALVKLILDTQPRLIIHCHSWEPCVVYAGERAKRDAQRLAQASGYRLADEIGYPTPGSLSQWGWYDHGFPVICIEEQEHTPLAQVWPHFAEGMKAIFADPDERLS